MIAQKSTVGNLNGDSFPSTMNNTSSHRKKYVQIRVKSLRFMDQEATAIYFYNITHQIESL